ncbi:LysE family translocator [Arthrobacter sp. 24S4-2]|uniref:LysE family translocator n=1 Tax=Arthrobacter sp. 24S4-2 TaxID=2575374 RepID=UPI0010C7C23D|nr:LysE family translocator [Arthrobacter sp. 24S4-2]QCO98684.1 LysE family translocator [Arthrobacter sp. 24S4-2]
MSVTESLLQFALVAALLTVIPGLDTILVLRTAISRGRAPAFATAAGICTGTVAWGLAAALGASALLAASEAAFTVLKIAGACYMAWLGISMFIRTFRNGPVEPVDVPQAPSSRGAWLTGVTTSLLNPKVGVFYMAMIPQFLPQDVPPLLMGILLPLVHNVEGMLWFAGIIVATQYARRWLQSPSVGKATDRIAGVVLIAFAAKIAASKA